MRPRGCRAWPTIPPELLQLDPSCGEAARWLDAALEAFDPDGAGIEEGEVIESRAVVPVVSQFHPLLNGLLLVLALAVPPGTAQENRATVLSIGDGDTIRMLEGGKRITVRLACIDAPEMAQAPYGANVLRYLQSWLRLGSSVILRPQTVDRFGRTVAEVIGEVNLNLPGGRRHDLSAPRACGYAYRKYLGQCDVREYLDAEFRASRHRFGVWQVPGGITRPWDFRRSRMA